jgi:hypothetical protein
MYKNTFDISFFLYLLLILICIAGFFWLIRKMQTTEDPARITPIIDFFKWAMVSIALVVISNVIGDHFKERDQDVEELQYFNTYVGDVKKADGVLDRLRLVTYLFTVAPSGPMKDAWGRYLTVVKQEKKSLDSLQQLIKPLQTAEATAHLNQTDSIKRDELEQEIKKLDAPLEKSENKKDEGFKVILGTDESLEAAQTELEKAKKIDPNASIEQRGNSYITVIEAINEADAKKLKKNAERIFNTRPFIVKAVE